MSRRLPVVSVITPSYNQAQFLKATLESVASQDYPSIEHIVMDGGSDDGSVEILKTFASDHSLQWTSRRDGGQADAIAMGFRRASGDILTWLNSDDIYLTQDVVSRVVEAFEAGASVVTGRGQYLDESGRRLGEIALPRGPITTDMIRRIDAILQPATFFRRSAFPAVEIDTSLHYAFDWDFFVQLSRIAPFTKLEIPVAGYRLHPAGKTVSAGLERQRELLMIARRYGRSRLVIQLMRLQITLRRLAPWLGTVLDRVAWWSNRLTDNHGLPC